MSTARLGAHVTWLMLSAACCIACSEERAPEPTKDAAVSADSGAPSKDASSAAEDAAKPAPQGLARAQAVFDSVPPDTGAVTGSADFAEHPTSIDFKLELKGCTDSEVYRLFIMAGRDCSDATLQGEHWDGARGEGIVPYGCSRPLGGGISYRTRADDDEKPWTIGGPPASDIVGHAMAVIEKPSMKVVACGVIERTADAPRAETDDKIGPTRDVRAAVAGICLYDRLISWSERIEGCPNYDSFVGCASDHCDLDLCIDSCASYVSCIARSGANDVCSVAYTCEVDAACSRCQGELMPCVSELCRTETGCSRPPSPDGACAHLRACCADQGDKMDECLELADTTVHFGGDEDCARMIEYWNQEHLFLEQCPFDTGDDAGVP